ncbi:MAG: transposase [Acidobacteria bacterium]|nr:MAG: transposase [Acidobacteriota bacterium]REJ99143.1 MAG: transposase [Acidobacteriota bacterium]REK16136.1 MAG: transposase [Acidobacteriota bacterium]REK43817.1 MAG: transposase [Acidobacteriota bacterium]
MDRIFLTNDPNTCHYVTMVCNQRSRLFADEGNCRILARVFDEIREKHPFKLCSYVFMPDHVHMIVNPLRPELSTILNKIKGKSARLILDRLMRNGSERMLERLYLNVANRNYAVWMTRSAVIDLVSSEFMIQKTGYIHNNPVRAGLCKHPRDWKWSSYRALHPANEDPVPLRVDRPMHWKADEVACGRLEVQ